MYPSSYLPNAFEPEMHWYPKALNATIHPMVSYFMHLDPERILQRYCRLNPQANPDVLREMFNYKPSHFFWAGSDLIHVTDMEGHRKMVVIETNSCPSGQKSMPVLYDNHEQGGYRQLMQDTFLPLLKTKRLPKGDLAVLYDKNPMEASGYAAALADVSGEEVHYIPYHHYNENTHLQFDNGILIYTKDGKKIPIRAAFRYVTQKPWDRLPIQSKTFIFNPPIACLAGGRNKMLASKAYTMLNGELADSGLHVQMPKTIWDVRKAEIPIWITQLGGHAVIKVPYSNAGQGVYTITSQQELDAFMAIDHPYDLFIVQSMIGNLQWGSGTSKDRLYHVGTLPDKKGNSYVSDVRFMLSYTKNGYRPLAIYARKAAKPLIDQIKSGSESWPILGTNLSIKKEVGWDSDTNRLLLMDRKDFNKLGIGLDDLIDGYVQTLLSVIAIDKLAKQLINPKGVMRKKLFRSLNNDDVLFNEIKHT